MEIAACGSGSAGATWRMVCWIVLAAVVTMCSGVPTLRSADETMEYDVSLLSGVYMANAVSGKYMVSIGTALTTTACPLPGSSSVQGIPMGACLNRTGEASVGLGSFASAEFEVAQTLPEDSSDVSWVLKYSGGDDCVSGDWVAVVSVHCSIAKDGMFEYVSGGMCEPVNFALYSASAAACGTPTGLTTGLPRECYSGQRYYPDPSSRNLYYEPYLLERLPSDAFSLPSFLVGDVAHSASFGICTDVPCAGAAAVPSLSGASVCVQRGSEQARNVGPQTTIAFHPIPGDASLEGGFMVEYTDGNGGAIGRVYATCVDLVTTTSASFRGLVSDPEIWEFEVASPLACPKFVKNEYYYDECPSRITADGYFYDIGGLGTLPAQGVSVMMEDGLMHSITFKFCDATPCFDDGSSDDPITISNKHTVNAVEIGGCDMYSLGDGTLYGWALGDTTLAHAEAAHPTLAGFLLHLTNGDPCYSRVNGSLLAPHRSLFINGVCDPQHTTSPQVVFLDELSTACDYHVEVTTFLACPIPIHSHIEFSCSHEVLYGPNGNYLYHVHDFAAAPADGVFHVTHEIEGTEHAWHWSLCAEAPVEAVVSACASAPGASELPEGTHITACHTFGSTAEIVGISSSLTLHPLDYENGTEPTPGAGDHEEHHHGGFIMTMTAPANLGGPEPGIAVTVICDPDMGGDEEPHIEYDAVTGYDFYQFHVVAGPGHGACPVSAAMPNPESGTDEGASGVTGFAIFIIVVATLAALFCLVSVVIRVYNDSHPASNIPDPIAMCPSVCGNDKTWCGLLPQPQAPAAAHANDEEMVPNTTFEDDSEDSLDAASDNDVNRSGSASGDDVAMTPAARRASLSGEGGVGATVI